MKQDFLALAGGGVAEGGGREEGGREGLLSPCSWRLFRISRWLVVIDSIWDAFPSSPPPEASAHARFLHRALIPAARKRNIPAVAGQWRLSPCQVTRPFGILSINILVTRPGIIFPRSNFMK